MSNYDVFAQFYDSLTNNVDYTGRAEYLLSLLKRLGHDAGITLDLACGTGSLTFELYKKGIDVYGIDSSPSMLSVAMEKAFDMDAEILFLCQKMENLDLYGTVQTVFCSLDSINHLKSFANIQKAFNKVSLFLEKDCYFIFDFNTVYKHREVLAQNCYVYENDEVYCVWQNSYKKENHRVDISLDFFEKEDKSYYRTKERFFEITCEAEELFPMLEQAGFYNIQIFDDMKFTEATEKTERITVVAQKKG
ncbi:MAG: class I SAM-dependent methyltransferase [Clostridia bacterium]